MDSKRITKAVGTAAAVLLLGAGPASAQSAEQGFYMKLEGGRSMSTGADIKDKVLDTTGVGVKYVCADTGCTAPGSVDDIGNGYFVGGGVGYRFNSMFRVDATITTRKDFALNGHNPGDDQLLSIEDAHSISYMANGYFDLPINLGPIKPYVGGGIGYARNTLSNAQSAFYDPGIFSTTTTSLGSGRTGGFAWQLMAGVGIEVAKNVVVDVGYRYFDGGKLKTDAGIPTTSPVIGLDIPYEGLTGELKTHEVLAGIRLNF